MLSTLWMLEVGHLFDAKLTGCAYGNRLRRTQDGKGINQLSLGSFQPYLKSLFRDWRDQGIEAMRSALEADKKIVALTADVSSFYHELNPGFMLNPDFITDVLGLVLDTQQEKLHRLFIQALQAWAKTTPLERGLPVGLPVSLWWRMSHWSSWIALSSNRSHRCTTAAMWTTSRWSWRTVPASAPRPSYGDGCSPAPTASWTGLRAK